MCSFHGQIVAAAELSSRYKIPLSTIVGRSKRGIVDDALIVATEKAGPSKGSVTRPTVRYGEYFGEKISAKKLAEMCGIKVKTMLERIRSGKKDAELTVPLQENSLNLAKAREVRRKQWEAKQITDLPIGYMPHE